MTPVLSPSMSSILGLHRVVPRLIAEDAFQNSEAALRGIAEYERFFLLAATNGKEPLVPSTWVDLVWQRHMLDSKAYTEDCDRWAGVYLHRDEGVPPGGFERSLALLGTPDPAVWNRPGPAFVQSDLNISCDSEGPTSDLESEELSGVLARVCQSLQTKPNAPPWVVDARDLLKTEPELAVREYRRFLMLMIRESGSLTPCKLVDEFWHQHILDSRAYLAFCSRVAGRYLHHRPSYEKPHQFHEPGFRRTQDIYRKQMGFDPPARIWEHMGESGGGDGGDGGGTPAPPLYAIDTPDRMCAKLIIGRVDRRFYQPLHPILAMSGVTIQLWNGLLQAVDSVPRPWFTKAAMGQEEAGRQLILRFGPVYRGHGVTLTLVTSGTLPQIIVDATLTDNELIFLEQDQTRRKLPYVINRPQRMRVIIAMGEVNPVHFQKIHPLLSQKGLTKRDWDEFLQAVATPPRISWAEFAAMRPNLLATSAISALGFVLFVVSCLMFLSDDPAQRGHQPSAAEKFWSALVLSLIAFMVVGVYVCKKRPFDQKGVQEQIARYIPKFKYHGITLDFVNGIEAVSVDVSDSNDQMLPWDGDEENQHCMMEAEAEKARSRQEAANAKDDERRRRRAERDSYYLDRGIKPGNWAWFRSLPDLHQAILLGLAMSLPLILLAVALYVLRSS